MAAKKKKRLTKAEAEALRKKRSRAAKRAWAERKAKAKRRSEAAKKAAATRKRKALEAAKKRKPAPKPKPKPKKRKPAPKPKRPTLKEKEKAEHARQAAEEARLERERKDEADRLERERQAEEIRREAERLERELERERQEAERRAEREPSPLPPWRDRLIRDFENITYRGRFVEDIEIIPNPDGSVMIFGYVEILGRRVQVQAYQVETETSGSRFWGQLQNTQAGNPVAAFEEGLYEDQDAPDAPDFITGWYDEAFDEDAA